MASGKTKKIVFLAVTLAVIANLLLGNNVFAKKFEISDKDFAKIKTGLSIIKIAANISISDAKLKTILNLALKGGETGSDITYGLLVLSSLSEMDFIDSVVTQKYKTEADQYFNSILDEQLNLRNYYKGIGFDIPRVLFGAITGPVAALTLNTFDISSRAIQIFTALQVLKRTMIYNGLFVYFDFRKGNETHGEAWELAKAEMGIGVDGSPYLPQKLKQNNPSQLEQQFASLYEKWAPYVEINKGIKQQFKEQAKEEWGQTIASAMESLPFAKEKQKFSLLERVKMVFEKITNGVVEISGFVKEKITVLNKRIKELTGFGRAEISQTQQENLTDEIEEGITELEQKIIKEEKIEEVVPEESENKPAEIIPEEPALADAAPAESALEEIKVIEIVEEVKPTESVEVRLQQAEKFCEKAAGAPAAQNKVIFNKIAWMGTVESENNEWFELKNVSGGDIDLAGWQILDKDSQIKISFVGGHRMSTNSVFILERTDDNSLSGVKAGLIYTGALNNTNEALYLFDNNCQLQDEVSANPDWPGGDKTNKKAMERNSDLSWWQEPVAPPPIFNYGVPSAPPPAAAEQPAALKILISEIQISPISERFVELFNPNDQAVNLSGWYIQRKTQTGSSWNSFITSTNFEGKTIGALGYFFIASSTSADILLNLTLTEGNSVRLKNSNQEIIEEVSWENPASGKSWGRQWSTSTQNYLDVFELQTPTPKSQNQSPSPASSSDEAPGAFFVSGEVVINEIAWAGTKTSMWDEWLELYNNATSDVDLANWTLTLTTGTTTRSINFSSSNATTTVIGNSNFYLLERTEKATNIPADLIYGGEMISNDGAKIELRDSRNNLIDSVDFSSGWLAGASSPNYISMERIGATVSGTSSANWASNNLIARNGKDASGNKINGTAKAKNSVSRTNTEIISNHFSDLTNEFSQIILTYLGSPYMIQESLIVQASNTLKIEPGVILKFKDSKEMEVQGSLEAVGGAAEEEKIVFMRSATSSPGNDRYRIYFASSTNSKIENVKFIDGGRLTYIPFYAPWGYISAVLDIETSNVSIKNSLVSAAFPKAISAVNSTTTIDNVEISDTKNSTDFLNTAGLFVEGGSADTRSSNFKRNTVGIKISGNASSTISGNNFEENEKPIYLSGTAYPVFSANTAQNNQVNGILADPSSIISDAVWESNLPYVIESSKSLSSGASLTLREGTTVKFKSGGYFNVYGRLLVEGTSDNPVVVTSIFDNDATGTLAAKGDWRSLLFNSSSTSVLDGVIIRYGTGYCQWGYCYGAITQQGGTSIEIKNSRIEENTWGVASGESNCADALQKIKLENVVFSENDKNVLANGQECQP